ncbi:penicillin-binding protein activator [Ammoniphilus sp. CFH 90114]|uniref:ABC transporter substrate-binding protein n=1 Tax=Ammoniphilus sp. CFH 90114 TaxID=2493665 RepID=UPI00100DE65B|nr:penicillin-binding protein activator [Ammoniphilus sp. CFH 90114]RXT02381.1 hypothetical protein EIZ39_24740 [Ammoniphilus sp. CFH 90114]
MLKKKAKGLAMLSLLLSVVVSGCGGTNTTEVGAGEQSTGENGSKVVKIGAVLPLTGVTAYYGTQIKQGIDLVLEELETQGGMEGLKIEVIYEDDKGIPAEAVNSTQKLITQDKVTAIIGPHSSSNTLAMRDITEREKVVQMTPAAGADNVTEPGHPYMFRYTLYNGQQAPVLAKFATEELQLKNIAVIAENTDFGRTAAEIFEKEVKDIGTSQVVSMEYYKPGDKDFYPQLTKMKNLSPDGVLISGTITEAAQIVKQIRDLGIEAKIMGTAALANDKFVELAGTAAEGVIHIGTFEPEAYDYFPDSKNMVERYKAKYGINPDMQVANGYGAMQIFAEAAKNSGGGDREKFREAMVALKEFPVVTGPVTFNENGQANQKLVIEKIENGKRVIIGEHKY